MIRVSSLDAAMLYAETPEMPMHTMGVVLLDSPGVPSALPFDVMRRVFEERIHLFPSLRRRLVQGPMQVGDPHWIDDPSFDLDQHLLRSSLPVPGTMRELEAFVGSYASQCLDRRKPLWELVLVEGLQDGKLAVVSKFHHAAMDGGRLVAFIGELFDTTPEPARVRPPDEPWQPDREPSMAWLAADTLRTLAGKPRRAAQAAAAVATSFAGRALSQRHRGQVETETDEKKQAHRSRLFEAPHTAFNGALSTQRAVALTDVALDDLKACKNRFGTTLNDVVLAACCASLRSWLLSHGGLPSRPLVVTVPVAVRAEGDEQAGNRVSMIRAHLPVQSDDPVERLLAIHQETSREKTRHAGGGGGDVFKHFTDIVTNVSIPWLLTQLVSFYSSSHLADHVPPLWNLVISNVPGPSTPLYFAGTRLLCIYPLGPAQQGSGLNITVMSSMDRLCFGAMACPELVPDLGDIAEGFREEIAKLKSLC